MLYSAFGLLISAIITIFTVPCVTSLGNKFNLIDQPNSRKQHRTPLVRIGGISIFAGTIISLIIKNIFLQNTLLADDFNQIYTGLLLSSFGFFTLGFFEDVLDLSPFIRLFFQTCLAIFAWSSGISINLDFLPISEDFLNPQILNLLNLVISVLWLVAITNAFNWMDGLDGLATGIAGISLMGLILISFKINNFEMSFISSALMGSCLGFLRFNNKPARILMGDNGSYFLGFNLASISILLFGSNELLSINHSSIFLALLILFVPIVDMLVVIFIRILNRKSPFYPDRNHFHHQLINLGFSDVNAVYFIYTLNFFFVSLTVFLADIKYKELLLITSISILIVYSLKSLRNLNSP